MSGNDIIGVLPLLLICITNISSREYRWIRGACLGFEVVFTPLTSSPCIGLFSPISIVTFSEFDDSRPMVGRGSDTHADKEVYIERVIVLRERVSRERERDLRERVSRERERLEREGLKRERERLEREGLKRERET